MNQTPPSTTILLVEPDDTVRPILTDNLRRWGYTVIVTLNGADALQRIQEGEESFNLILLNQFDQTISQLIDLGQQIRQEMLQEMRSEVHPEVRQETDLQENQEHPIPIVIMAEQYGVELEGQNIQVGDSEYVTYLEDGQQLKNLLYQLCPISQN